MDGDIVVWIVVMWRVIWVVGDGGVDCAGDGGDGGDGVV